MKKGLITKIGYLSVFFFALLLFSQKKDEITFSFPCSASPLGIIFEMEYDDPTGPRDEPRDAEGVRDPSTTRDEGVFVAETSGEFYSSNRCARLLRFNNINQLTWGVTMPGGAMFSWTQVAPLLQEESILGAQQYEGNYIRFQKYDSEGNPIGSYWDYDPSYSVWLAGMSSNISSWVVGDIDTNPQSIFLLNLNETGGFLVQKTWTIANGSFASSLVEDLNNGVFITGYVLQGETKSVFLAHFDENGNVINYTIPSNTNDELGISVDFDGKYIFVGGIREKVYSDDWDVKLWTFDTNLTLIQSIIVSTGSLYDPVISDRADGHIVRMERLDLKVFNSITHDVLIAHAISGNAGATAFSWINFSINQIENVYVFDIPNSHDQNYKLARTSSGRIIAIGSRWVAYSDYPVLKLFHIAEMEDSDNDGIPNFWENQMGLNTTDPGDAALDKDNDGMPNLWEYQMGLNATDPGDAGLDKDNDGMPNLWEYQMGLNATDPGDAGLDKDGDDLSNYQEYIKGTSPTQKDTDHDGWNDKKDSFPFNSIFPWLFLGLIFILVGISVFFTVRVYYYKEKGMVENKYVLDEAEKQTLVSDNYIQLSKTMSKFSSTQMTSSGILVIGLIFLIIAMQILRSPGSSDWYDLGAAIARAFFVLILFGLVIIDIIALLVFTVYAFIRHIRYLGTVKKLYDQSSDPFLKKFCRGELLTLKISLIGTILEGILVLILTLFMVITFKANPPVYIPLVFIPYVFIPFLLIVVIVNLIVYMHRISFTIGGLITIWVVLILQGSFNILTGLIFGIFLAFICTSIAIAIIPMYSLQQFTSWVKKTSMIYKSQGLTDVYQDLKLIQWTNGLNFLLDFINGLTILIIYNFSSSFLIPIGLYCVISILNIQRNKKFCKIIELSDVTKRNVI